MATCPFMSNPDGLIDCIESDCKIWDSNNSQCSLKISSILYDKLDKLDHIYKYVRHIHNEHRHSYPHNNKIKFEGDILDKIDNNIKYYDYDDHNYNVINLDYDCGSPAPISSMPPAAILQQEFVNGEDLDRNGKIFGKDFIIDPNDENCPVLLLSLYSRPDLDIESIQKETWNDYLNTLPFGS